MPSFTPNLNLAKPLVNDPTDEDLWGDQINENMDILDAAIGALGDSGAILPAGLGPLPYSGTSVPTGWLECTGAAVSRSTYSDLFAAIGTIYGTGDGASTFNLPFMARRTTVGRGGTGTTALGNTVGSAGGAETHTLTTAQMPSHSHTGTTNSSGTHTHTIPLSPVQGAGASAANGTTQGGNTASTNPDGAHTHTFTTAAAGNGEAHNILQPSLVTMMIIKT